MRAAIFLLALAAAAPAAVKVEKTAYQGWSNCYRVTNGEIELIVTANVGPRIIRVGFLGGQNLFKEYAVQMGKSGEREFQIRGGHRLWVAPEDLKTTEALDNGPLSVRILADGVEATQPIDSVGIQKQIVVKMAATGTGVEVIHRVKNTGPFAIEFAPWALSVMAPGGTAITGYPPRGKHPQALLPTNPLVLWAYTNLADPRWKFTAKYLILRQDPKATAPQKIGLFNPNTWGAYLLGTELFFKQAKADPSRTYPDFGCSYETYTDADMLELETLGPLSRVLSGGSVEHVERWTLRRNVKMGSWSETELDQVLGPLIGK